MIDGLPIALFIQLAGNYGNIAFLSVWSGEGSIYPEANEQAIQKNCEGLEGLGVLNYIHLKYWQILVSEATALVE